jgi:hypothetical protein
MLQPQRERPDDITIVERRREIRIILSIPARYELANRCDPKGNRREFSGRIVNISSHAMTLLGPVCGAIGERVIVHCDEFGLLQGQIARELAGGFVVTIVATDEEYERLGARIEGYEKIKNHDFPERRAHKRIIPRDPRSKLFFGDDSRMDCLIIDLSASGAAISADVAPTIGTPLAVGTLVGRVVRHFDGGFAVRFIEIQDSEGLEKKLGQP